MSAGRWTPAPVLAREVAVDFDRMWDELGPIGRDGKTNGYHRFAWTPQDLQLREWFEHQAAGRGMEVVLDRAGNQWAWWGDPDDAVARGKPGVVLGSHLDSVPNGGAYDGPLGVVSSFCAVDILRRGGGVERPVAVVNFSDEEGARFGVACAGSRIITGMLDPGGALGLRDRDGTSLAEALTREGRDPSAVGPDRETLRRIGAFVELHVEQGRSLVDLGEPLAVAGKIIPHGRWRLEVDGEANHAGTTRLADRHDPMLGLAALITDARSSAQDLGCVATIGKVHVEPGGVNAIPSRVTAWLDARGPSEALVRCVADEVSKAATTMTEESFTAATTFPAGLRDRIASVLDAPVLDTGAGHDAGILALAGVESAMVFVRNPTGVSHSPAEFAEPQDCHAGVAALAHAASHLCGETLGANSVAATQL